MMLPRAILLLVPCVREEMLRFFFYSLYSNDMNLWFNFLLRYTSGLSMEIEDSRSRLPVSYFVCLDVHWFLSIQLLTICLFCLRNSIIKLIAY